MFFRLRMRWLKALMDAAARCIICGQEKSFPREETCGAQSCRDELTRLENAPI